MLPIILSSGLILLVAAYFYSMDFRHILNRRTCTGKPDDAAIDNGDSGIYIEFEVTLWKQSQPPR